MLAHPTRCIKGWFRVQACKDQGMTDIERRSVSLERLQTGVYRATNARGGTLDFGSNAGEGFSPVELLLAAIGGCSAVDVDTVTSRRVEPTTFTVTVDAEYVRDHDGNILRGIQMVFDLHFPEGEEGDKARRVVPNAVRTSHERTCTVSRTVQAGTPVNVTIR